MKTLMESLLLSAVVSSAMAAAPGHPQPIAARQTRARAQASSAKPAPVPGSLPIINDDYGRARAEANKRKLPLFIEVWAPW